jgi:hypothetical protein
VPEFPCDLLELQDALLRAEAAYREQVGVLYGHPVMVQAREDGTLADVSARLRAAAKTA